MAEDDMGDKTEAPTPRKRAEAREQGNIARSPDLTAALLLMGMFVLLKWFGPALVQALKVLISQMLSRDSLRDFNVTNALETIVTNLLPVGKAMLPIFGGVMLIAIIANIMQVGLILSGKRLQPNIEALNPFKGFGKLLSGRGSPVQILMNLAKLALVLFAGYSAIHDHIAQIITMQQLSFLQIFGLSSQLIYDIGIRIGFILLVLAAADYAYQRYRTEKQLKMTKQEVKEEMRHMEGDPQVKNRRRQIAQQMATNRLKKAVPTADVVVTNPTEFAVALKYDSNSMHAPRVVAKGQGYIAMRIRQIAIENGIPILERKPLARALYKLVEVGQEIPEEFYSAVAEILAYVYELTGKLRNNNVARATSP